MIAVCDKDDCIYNEDGFCDADMIHISTLECDTYTGKDADNNCQNCSGTDNCGFYQHGHRISHGRCDGFTEKGEQK